MKTIKSYTSLEQSKKLAEILPLESANMWYSYYGNSKYNPTIAYKGQQWFLCQIRNSLHDDIPCWSLAALFNSLPNEISTGERYCDKYQIDIRKYDGGDNTTLYQIAYGNNRGLSGSWHDMINTSEKESAVDTCVEMILELHELKML